MANNGLTALLKRLFTREQLSQLVRFGLVGIAQNGVGFLLFLLLVRLGVDPKLVVTVCYPLGVLLSYLGNKKITFGHTGGNARALFRYVLVYASGYVINLAGLFIFVDIMRWPYQWVQFGIIVFLVVYFFLLLKFFVFAFGKNDEPNKRDDR